MLPPEQRASDFREVTAGLSEKEARFESARCYSCGNCFECDGCYGACPESAIIKLGKGKRYEINYDHCTGCQACFLQCPCHAIEMIATEAWHDNDHDQPGRQRSRGLGGLPPE